MWSGRKVIEKRKLHFIHIFHFFLLIHSLHDKSRQDTRDKVKCISTFITNPIKGLLLRVARDEDFISNLEDDGDDHEYNMCVCPCFKFYCTKLQQCLILLSLLSFHDEKGKVYVHAFSEKKMNWKRGNEKPKKM